MTAKILTVDDSKTIRLIVAKAFKDLDCQIFEASNGVEGLAAAAKELPDVIILDLTMPVMDGGEMLGKLKLNPELKAVPVIMLTAEAGRETVLRIAKMGVRDYLIKPFKEEMLVERVRRVIDLKPRGEEVSTKRFDDALSILFQRAVSNFQLAPAPGPSSPTAAKAPLPTTFSAAAKIATAPVRRVSNSQRSGPAPSRSPPRQ